MIELNRLYAITDTALAGCPHEEIVSSLCGGGCKLIQLREKNLPTRDFYSSAMAAVQLAHNAGARVIVNDRVDIAKLSGADGVHLGQEDLSPEKARALLGRDAIIGFSTHSIEQALAANRQPVDYIAVGPIFRTDTKPEASAGVANGYVGLDLLRAVRAAVDKPLVAIGGITIDNAVEVLRAGAAAVAVISDLLKHGSTEERTRRFLSQITDNY